MDASISGVTSGGGLFTDANTSGVVVAATANSIVTFDVFNNTMLGTGSTAIVVRHFTNATINGKVRNNSITHVAGPGTDALSVINQGDGSNASPTSSTSGNGTGTISVSSNSISGNFERGIYAQSAFSNGTLNLTIDNNNPVNGTDTTGTGLQAIFVEMAGSGQGSGNDICLNMHDNTVTFGPGATYTAAYRLVNRNTTNCTIAGGCTYRLQDFAGNGSVVGDVQTWVTTTKSNSGTPVSVTINSNPFVASSGPCATPVLPMSLVGPGTESIQSAGAKTDTSSDSADPSDLINNLVAHLGVGPGRDDVPKLSSPELFWMVQHAIQRWRDAGVSPEDVARLERVTFEIADLPDALLAQADGTRIKIDETAAGYGWFFDQTPNEDSEFDVPVPGRELQTTEYSPAHGKVDLLTVLMSELGTVYLQGKTRVPKQLRPLMNSLLPPGVRRLPDLSSVQILPPQSEVLSASQTAPAGSGSSSQTSGPLAAGRRSGAVQTASKVVAQSGETVSQALGTIPAGEKVTLQFQVTINNPLPANVCTVTNPAANSGANVTGDNFNSVTIAADSATIVKPPTIGACPNDITKNTDAGVCTAVATFTTPTSDACPAATVTCNPASGFAFAKGITTVTCTAANGNLPNSTCTFTVAVSDMQAPTFSGCTNLTPNTAPGVCTATATYTPTATDNCDGSRPVTCMPASGSTFNKGVTTVTCLASDTSNNTAMCMFTVTVTDNQAPVVTCPPSGGAFAASDCLPSQRSAYTGATLYSTGGNTVTNAVLFGFSPCTAPPVSGSATINFTGTLTGDITIPPSSLTHFQAPVTGSMKLTFNNLTGSTRTFDTEMLQLDISGGNLPATVKLRESPTLTSTGQTKITTITGGFHIDSFFDVFTELSTNSGANFTPDPTARHISAVQSTDSGACNAVVNYPAATATDNCDGTLTPTCTPASGTTFSKGTTTVACSATDTSTLTGSCTFTVTVVDTQLPTLTCPNNISVIGNVCQTETYTTPTPSDNCTGATASCAPASGTCFAVGTTTVTCTATDTSDNTNSCSFTVTVTPCTVTCPPDISDNVVPGTCAKTETFADPTTTGQCGAVTCSPASGASFPKGVTTVTCTSAAGPSCSFTVTINDNEAPTITCPSPITQNTDPGVCTAVVSFTPTVNDNCPGATPSCSPASGSVFPKGVTTVSCKAIDASSNVSPACTFTVTVVDNQPPTVVCPANISKNTDPNLCTAVATYVTPAGSDNCAVQSVVCTPASGAAFAKGVTTVTCTVTDTANLTGMCTFKVTVSNPCTITCPPDQTASTGPGATQCGTVVSYPAPTTTGGGCGTVACSPASGSFFPVGMTTVTCTTSGPSCSFKVMVVDNTPPVFPNCAEITMTAQPSCPFATGTAVSFTTPAATDNCPGTPTVACIPPAGSQFPVGTTTVTCTATDGSNNTATCTFGVNVFSFCLQDDSSPGNVVFVNATTGDYVFCSGGVQIASGRGTLTVRGCQFGIEHIKGDRKVIIGGDTSANSGNGGGTAFIQKANGHMVIQITDRNLTNNTCQCSPSPPQAIPREKPDPGKRVNGN